MQLALLAAWVCWQPWFSWPGVFPDTAHRLTLVLLSVGLGAVSCSTLREATPLPRGWTALGAALAWTMAYRAWPVVRSGEYFSFFIETAAWADGALILAALWWGAWALRQFPLGKLRMIPRLMLGLLAVNTAACLWQVWRGTTMEGHLTGLLGVDRLLAAYVVACLPWCLAASPWLGLWPVALILGCFKSSAWVGVAAVVWAWRPRWALVVLPLAASVAWWGADGTILTKCSQRGLTWWHALQATSAHPFVGWGFSPMVLGEVRQRYGYLLPAVHSDWLALAVHAGWVVTGLTLAFVWQVVVSRPRSWYERCLRASLLGLCAIAAVQSSLSHPRLGSLALLLAVWWVVERSSTKECQA